MRDDWVETTLGEVARTRPPAGVAAPGIPYVALEHFDSGNPALHRWGDTADATSATTPFEPGDVLFGKLRPYLRKVVVTEFSGRCTNEALAYRVSSPALSQEYLALLLRSDAALSHASVTTGTRMPRTSARSMASMRVLLPSIEEQRRIVDLMSHVDSLRTALSEEAARLFSALCAFRDSIWNVPQRVPLSRYCRVDGGLVDPTGEGQRDRPHVGTDRIASGTGDLIGVQSASEDGVTSGKFEFSERHVVYSKIRPNLMKVAMPTFSGLCSADAYPLLPAPGVPRRWLQQLLLTTEFTTLAVSQSGRTKMPKINQSALMGLMVPDIADGAREEQAVVLDALDALRVGLGKERDALDRQRAALLGSLLTGDHEIPSSYDEFIRDEGAA